MIIKYNGTIVEESLDDNRILNDIDIIDLYSIKNYCRN